MKTTLAAIALLLVPGMTFAECAGMKHTKTSAAVCSAGTVWDGQSGKCVPTNS